MSGRVAGAPLALVLVASAAPTLAAPPNAPSSASSNAAGELDALRQECIAAARDVRQREQAPLWLDHTIDLLGRDAGGRQRGLDESRVEQAHLLATLAYIARVPPDRVTVAPAAVIDRARGELLLQGTLP